MIALNKSASQLVIATVLMTAMSMSSLAAIDTYEFDNPRQEAQYRALIAEFRCPKCQNQNLAGSDAPIAQDLKQKTFDMVKDGRSDAEIRKYMNERYGDFISYKPPVRPSTWILWFFPPLLLIVVLLFWFIKNRHSSKRQIAVVTQHETDINVPLSSAEQDRLKKLLDSNTVSDNTISSTNSNGSKEN